MNAWFPETFVQCLGWTLVHFLWQGVILAALLAIFLRTTRNSSSNIRYLAGCAALLLAAAAPAITFHHFASQSPAPTIAKLEMPSSAIAGGISSKPDITISIPSHGERAHLTASQRLEMLFPFLVLGWFAGVFAFSIRLMGGWIQVRRLRRSAEEALDKFWNAKLAGLALTLGIRRPVRLLQSALVEVPTVIGWLRPIILLPASCLIGLTPTQLESILAHELAHIRRHDYLVNLLQTVVETLLFYHPAVWWISRRIREERENCCDDLAVQLCGDRATYARALATLEEMRLAPMSAPLALAASGPPLLPRIRRLAGQSAATTNRPAWPLAGIIALAIIAILTVSLRGSKALADDNAQPAATRPTNATPRVSKPTRPQNWQRPLRVKLDSIEIDSIKYDHLPFTEVINQLSEIAKSRDPDKQGVNFFIDTQKPLQSTSPGSIDPATGRPIVGVAASDTDIRAATVTIEPALNHLRLSDALDAIVRCADQPIAYSVLDYAVVFRLKGPDEIPLETRTFHVDPNTFRQGLEGVTGVSFGNVSGNGNANGTGNVSQGATTTFPRVDVTRGISGVTSPAGNQGISGAPSASTGNATSNLQANVRNFFTAVGVDLSASNSANVGKMFTYNDRKGILLVRSTASDLDKIEAAIQALNSSSNQSNTTTDSKPANPQPKLAPSPSSDKGTAIEDTGETPTVRFNLDGSNRLNSTIQQNTNATPKPAYPQSKPARLSSYNGTGDTNLHAALGNYFVASGVDLSSNIVVVSVPAVRLSTNAPNKIDAAVQNNLPSEPKPSAPPAKPSKPEAQVQIEVKFVEVDEAKSGPGARDWLEKQIPGYLETTNTSPAPLPTNSANSTNAFARVTNSIIAQFTGILTRPQFTNAIHALEQNDGVDILTGPELTTESGRQAQVQTTTVTTVVTGLKSSRDADGKVKDEYQTASVPLGSVLDIIPQVSPDATAIKMKVVASITEFLGYDDPKHAPKGSPEKPAFSKGTMPLPRFRLRQMTTDATVQDGNTLVLSGMEADRTVVTKNKVPLLGDMPLLGPLFRSTTSSKTRKTLLVFITPTLITPEGNRLNDP